jgi:hypothetical protein
MTYALGRVVQHDPRSLAFPAATAPLKTVTHRLYGPVLDQGDLGACTGFAIAQTLNTVPLRHGRPLLNANDARFLYHLATVLDGFPGVWEPDDTGSSGLAAAKAAKQQGLISSYRHAFGIDQALGALVVSSVIIGVSWRDSMWEVDGLGYLDVSGNVVGGHEVSLIGIDARRERVTLLNNWSASWGRNGRAYLTFDALDTLLRDQGDVTVPVL